MVWKMLFGMPTNNTKHYVKRIFRSLLIGDQPECLRLLRQQQFEVVCADRLANGLAQLKTSPVGLVLMMLSLPDTQGTEAFVKVHEAAPHLPVIVLATRAEEKLATSLMSLGAQDYLFVPELTGPMLARAVHNASERNQIREEHSRAGHLLELLMDNIPDSIYFKDKASQYVMINRALANRFGLADPIWRWASRMRTFSHRITRSRRKPTNSASCRPASRWWPSKKRRHGRMAG